MTFSSVAADAEGGDFELCLAEAGGLPTLIPAPALQQRLDFRCRFPSASEPPAEPLPPVVVHLHIHYLELASPLLAALERCLTALQPFSLLVSTTSSQRAADLAPVLEASAAAQAASARELVVTRNIGRNLGPLLVELWPRLREAPLLLHLHGKRTPQNRLGGPWLEALLATLLPGPQEVAALRASFQQHPSLGLVIPEAPVALRSFLNWGNNFELASLLADWHPEGLPLSRLAPLVFPAGMMLWCRPAALQPLARQLTEQGNLPLEPLRVDGTSLHAAERLVVHSCEAVGLDWALIASQAPRSGLTPARFSVWKPEEELFLQATSQWLHGARREFAERAGQAGAEARGEEQALLRQSLAQAEEACARLQTECQALEWRRLQVEAESQTAQSRHRSDQELIAELQHQSEQARDQARHWQEQCQSTRQELEVIEGQIEAASQALQRLQEEKQGLQQDKQGLEREREGLQQALQRGKEELQHSQQALQSLQEKHQGLQQNKEDLQQAVQRLQEENERLQNQQSLAGTALSGVRAELESSQADRQQEQRARQGAELRLAALEGSRTWRWRRQFQGWLRRPPG